MFSIALYELKSLKQYYFESNLSVWDIRPISHRSCPPSKETNKTGDK